MKQDLSRLWPQTYLDLKSTSVSQQLRVRELLSFFEFHFPYLKISTTVLLSVTYYQLLNRINYSKQKSETQHIFKEGIIHPKYVILFMSCFAPDSEYTVMSEQKWTLPHLRSWWREKTTIIQRANKYNIINRVRENNYNIMQENFENLNLNLGCWGDGVFAL